jgi:hypothetical protein
MTLDTFSMIMIIACFGVAIFNLGQAYALLRETRLENQRHIETLLKTKNSKVDQ